MSLRLSAVHLWPLCRLFQDNDLLDKRKHCFSVQTESGEDMFFSVELDCELLIWEKAFQTATFLEVERIQVRCHGDRAGTEVFLVFAPAGVTSSRPVSQCKTYACIMESHLMGLTVDFSMGFVCFDAASKVGARRSSILGRTRNKRPHLSEKTETRGARSPTQNPLPLMLHFGRVPCKLPRRLWRRRQRRT